VDVHSDGAVVVTAAYEVRDNTASAYTTLMFCASDEGDPVFVGACRASNLKAKVFFASKMQLLLSDLGTPMNGRQVFEEAFGRAKGELSRPLSSIGYAYVFSGLVKASLGGGTNGVQYEWGNPATSSAYTHVFVNAPGGRGPLGPAGTWNFNTDSIKVKESGDRNVD
jgi:hypothetical protein